MLSSLNLFSFTTKYDVLKIILQKGFRYSKWKETLPKSSFEQENYIICFCDILWEQNAEHRKCYGNNGLVMTKEWGVQNQISPVRYINSTSVGMSDAYIQRKFMHREYLEKNNYEFEEVLLGEMITENFIVDGSLNQKEFSLAEKLKSDQDFRKKYLLKIDEFEKMEQSIVNAGYKNAWENLKGCICRHIEALYDELEHRDAYERNYQEDFKHHTTGNHPNKILYDEREWRSVKFLDKKALKNKSAPDYLQESENLKFEDKDVVAVLVERKEFVDEVKALIKSGKTLLDSTSDNKVYFVDEFKE